MTLNTPIFLAIIAMLIAQSLKVQRWKLMLYQKDGLKSLDVSNAMFIGMAVNILLPFKLGEVARIIYLRKKSESIVSITFTVILERIFDALVLTGLFIVYLAKLGQLGELAIFWSIVFPLMLVLLLLTIYVFRTKSLGLSNFFAINTKKRILNGFLHLVLNIRKIKANIALITVYSLLINSLILFSFGILTKFNQGEFIRLVNRLVFAIADSTYSAVQNVESLEQPLSSLLLFVIAPLIGLYLPPMFNKNELMTGKSLGEINALRLSIVPEYASDKNDEFFFETVNAMVRAKESRYFTAINEVLNDCKLLGVLNGGSGDEVYVISKDGELRVRKASFGDRKRFLKNQYLRLIELSNEERSINVIRPLSSKQQQNWFYYDMPFIQSRGSYLDFLHTLNEKTVSEEILRLLPNPEEDKALQNETSQDDRTSYFEIYQSKFELAIEHLKNMELIYLLNRSITINNRIFSAAKFYDSKKLLQAAIIPHSRNLKIHGDLTVSNILVDDKNQAILIDPNPGQPLMHTSVDVAKLLQSFRLGYEFNYGQEINSLSNETFKIRDFSSQIYRSCEKTISDWLEKSQNSSIVIHVEFQLLLHLIRIIPYTVTSDQAIWLIHEVLKQVEYLESITSAPAPKQSFRI